jgi:hypothetical protein
MSDLLVVSLGTTHGLRVADTLLVEMLREAGASTDPIQVRIGVADRLRRGYPVNDLVEALAARRALTQALQDRPPTRAVLFSTTTAALLAGGGGPPYAVRLDSPAALNRPGPLNAPVRALERRSLAGARLVIALGRSGAAAIPAGSARAEIVPVPIDPSGDAGQPRDPDLAVAYVPDPKTKGLARLCTAWAQVAGGRRRLEVFGIDRALASTFLARQGLPQPPGVTFRGYVSNAAFRAALRGARCFVSAARWEDYGQAPLEALRDGALLVTAPTDGPYEALPLARELDAGLVAPDMRSASLGAAIGAAFQRTVAACATYREHAAALLEPYRRERAVEALRAGVLPVLLNKTRSS